MIMICSHYLHAYVRHTYSVGSELRFIQELYIVKLLILSLLSHPFSSEFFFGTCHNFFSLSSVQIIIIPACCLLCVLKMICKKSL